MKYLAIAMALMLGACTLTPLSVAPEIDEEEVAAGQTWIDAEADKIIAADTPRERALRVCFFTAWTSSRWSMAARFGYATPDEIAETYTSALKLLAATNRIKASTDSLWFNSEMAYLLIDVKNSLTGPFKKTILQYATYFFTGDWAGILGKLQQAAGENLLTRYMILDIKAFYDRLEAGEATVRRGMNMCERRIKQNMEVLETFMGLNFIRE